MPTTMHKSTPFEIVRATRLDAQVVDITPGTDNTTPLVAIKYGKWGYCSQPVDSDYYSECTNPLKYDYTQVLTGASNINNNVVSGGADVSTIDKSWTRGLLVGAVALGMATVAFLLNLIPSLVADIFTSIAYILATLLALIAFILDIVIFVKARATIHAVYDGAHVIPGPSFYFDLIAIPLLFISSLSVCIGAICGHRERKDRKLYEDKIASTHDSTVA